MPATQDKEGARNTDASRDTTRSWNDYFATEHLGRDIVARSVRAGAVTLTAQGVKVAIQFMAIVFLARLLAPEDFGTFAMVATVVVALELFKDMGLSTATIQRADLTERQVSTVFWLNVALGATAFLVISALAPALVALFDEPILMEITPVVGMAFLLTGFATQHLALLQRQMHFTAVALVQTCAEVVALSVAVTAAWMGFGLWSLVFQRLAWAAAIAIGAWSACGWRPGRPGPLGDVRGLVKFGGNATGSMMAGHLAANLDKVLIGWWWGASALGLFERAQKILMIPIQNLNGPLGMVAMPALSRLANEPERYRQAYISAVTRLTMLVAPVGGLLIAAGDLVARIVLGPQWTDAGPILIWMGVTAVYMPASYTFSWLYISQDRTPEMLRAGLLNAGLILVSLAAGLPFGPVGVAAAYAVGGAAVRIPVLAWLVCRHGPVRTGDLARILALPICATVAVVGAVLAVRAWPPMDDASHLLEGAIAALATAAAALVTYALFPRGRRILRDIAHVPAILRGREARA